MTDQDNSPSLAPMNQALKRAYQASIELEKVKGVKRSEGIFLMAQGLEKAFDDILEANTLDLEMSREMAIPDLILHWLKLTPERLENVIELLYHLKELSDPIQRLMNAPYQLQPSQTYCQLMPLGVIAFVYEAFPELSAIAAGFCLKTGNSIILRGCNEASHSNQIIIETLQNALEEAELPCGCIEALSCEEGASIEELVTEDHYINLVIPYGRPSLIQQVSQLSTAPVLKTTMGNCYLYWSSSGDLELTRSIILDSHKSQPDPVNAIEKVLIDGNQKSSSLSRLFSSLKEYNFELRGDESLLEDYPEYLTMAAPKDWKIPYLKKIIAFKVVDNITEAIELINRNSSGHADCIVTESYQESRQFAMGLDSALVYINSSPRFVRNPLEGESIFLGMSNQKGYHRGLIGLESFMTLKQIVQGAGHLYK
jgi:glutamate-5-semialdehyde dehydrogenase